MQTDDRMQMMFMMRPGRGLTAYSQPDGSFEIDNVLPGEYAAVVDRDYEERKTFKVDSADVTDLVFEVEPAGSIAGRVVAGGKPVDGASVRVTGESWAMSTTSGADGSFVLRNIRAGTYSVYAESHRAGAFTQGPKVTLAAGEDKTGVEVELDLAGKISGVVVDKNDAPVAGVFLSFSLLGGRDYGNATTADDGSFTVGALSGGGDYIFEIKQREQSQIVYPPVSGRRHLPISVKDGQTHVSGVRIKILYERLAISGRLTTAAGKPIADAQVTATQREERWYRLPLATTDQNGAFTIRDLPAGNYTVKATTPRGEARAENIAAGSTNVALRLKDPGGIDGTLKGFSGTPIVSAMLMHDYDLVNDHRATVTGTTFQLRDLEPGRYRVRATAGGDVAQETVEVVSGANKAVTLTVRENGTVVGTVVDDKGKPVAGLRCMTAQKDEAMIIDNGPSPTKLSDAAGNFRIDRAPAGSAMIGCFGEGLSGFIEANVIAGQVTRAAITVKTYDRPDRDGGKRSGLTLEEQLGDVFVKAVEPNSAGARAGIAIGDVIVSIDGKKVERGASWEAMRDIELASSTEVKLVLERKEKELTVVLKLEPLDGAQK
jgi:uncharacterized protein (DUF2141 family)